MFVAQRGNVGYPACTTTRNAVGVVAAKVGAALTEQLWQDARVRARRVLAEVDSLPAASGADYVATDFGSSLSGRGVEALAA